MARLRGTFGLGATIALSASLLCAAPALAQKGSGSNSGASSAATMKLGDKAPNGGLMKTHDDWRASGLVGATVYNDQGNSIGAVSDVLVSSDGSVQNVVISVGGFLGIGSKLVEVPFNTIKFAPSASNPASGSKETQASPPSTAMSATAPANSAGTAGTTGIAAPANGAGTAPASVPAAGLGAPTNTGPGGITGATARGAGMMPTAHEYSLVLPGATKASLTSDPAFSY